MRRVLLVALLCLWSGAAFAASLAVTVDISEQTMYVDLDGQTAHVWPVSTGRKGYRTPTGTFSPSRMYKTYFSRKYDNAPMPYSIFYSGGFAIHGTTSVKALGAPASHGCVRLHPDNARLLYGMVQEYGRGNTIIRIVR